MSKGCLLLPYNGWGVLKPSMAPIITIFLSYHLVGQPYSLPACFLLPSFSVAASLKVEVEALTMYMNMVKARLLSCTCTYSEVSRETLEEVYSPSLSGSLSSVKEITEIVQCCEEKLNIHSNIVHY